MHDMRTWIVPTLASLTLHIGVFSLFLTNRAEEVNRLSTPPQPVQVQVISSAELQALYSRFDPPEVMTEVPDELVEPVQEVVEDVFVPEEVEEVVIHKPTPMPIPMPKPEQPISRPPPPPPPPPPAPEPVEVEEPAPPVEQQNGNSDIEAAEVKQIDGEIQADFARYFKYPKAAKRSGIEALVQLEFVVNPDGSISNIVVTNDVPEILKTAALRSLRQVKIISKPSRAMKFSLNVRYTLK